MCAPELQSPKLNPVCMGHFLFGIHLPFFSPSNISLVQDGNNTKGLLCNTLKIIVVYQTRLECVEGQIKDIPLICGAL